MNGGVIPHHQQTAYDRGRADGRRIGFGDGAEYGRRLQKMHDEMKPHIGFALGVLASVLVFIVCNLMGWLP